MAVISSVGAGGFFSKLIGAFVAADEFWLGVAQPEKRHTLAAAQNAINDTRIFFMTREGLANNGRRACQPSDFLDTP